jgi:branched-chain amino acid transport system permease protein
MTILGNTGDSDSLNPVDTAHRSAPKRRLRRLVRKQGSGTNLFIYALIIAGAIWAGLGNASVNLIGQYCIVYGIAALGQQLLIGSAGQVALSGAAFMCIGAFTTGMLASVGAAAFPIPILVSAAIGLIVGLVSGLPGLRFRGLYLLLSSLALLFIVVQVAQMYENTYHPGGLNIPLLYFLGLDLSVGRALYVALLVILFIVYAIVAWLDRTGVGLVWHTIRESEIAAAIAGVNVVRWKLYAFAASGAITSVAGSLFAYVVGFADAGAFDLTLSITLLTMVFIGGVSSRSGALLGAAVITVLPTLLASTMPGLLSKVGLASGWYATNRSEVDAGLFSLLFLIVVLFEPSGLEGLMRSGERRIRNLVSSKKNRADLEVGGQS